MKPNKRIQATMNDRLRWLKGWVALRNYEIGQKRSDFLYIYYSTMRMLYSQELSAKLLQDMNDKFSFPIAADKLAEIIEDVEKLACPNKYKNSTIVSKLGIKMAEIDTLGIGRNMKEARERELRQMDAAALICKIEQMYAAGKTAAQIAAEIPQRSKRSIQRDIAKYKERERVAEEEKRLANEIFTLYMEEDNISTIARRAKCSVDTVRRILNLSGMTAFTIHESFRESSELQGFKNTDCEELYVLSNKTERTQAGVDEYRCTMAALQTYTNNICIVGAAGSGKTYLIREFLASLPPEERAATLIVAPTGRAADNLDAQTIHRAFHLDNAVQPNEAVTAAPKKLYSISRLIIDELNMVRIDIFTKVMRTIQHIEQKTKKHIQVIVLGDFGQIQPVATTEDMQLIKQYYPGAQGVYAFQSELWEQMGFRKIVLKTIYRQNDPVFIEKLQEIKFGKLSAVQWFNENAGKIANTKAIYICPTNKLVDYYNTKAMRELPNCKVAEYTATVKGGSPKEDVPCPQRLLLSVGMRVMTVCNTDQYKNGSMGEVVKLNRRSIQIKFDNGNVVTVRSKKFVLQGGITYEQIPVVLAYAITANKAEGMTFEQINVVPGFFAPGQLYTALSRATSICGINLVKKLTAKDLIVDIAALEMTIDR